jgi:hypothetical protein
MTAGGFRPTAPQNNPKNVSVTGGNGQNKDAVQAARYIPGQAWGQGQATMQQQTSAPMAGDSTAPTPISATPHPGTALPVLPNLMDAVPRTSGTTTDGIDSGPGPGASSLNLPSQPTPNDNGVKAIQALYMLDPTNQDIRNMLESLSVQGRM